MPIAITRAPSPAMSRCELTHLPRQAIDPDAVRAQHRRYERVLTELGVELVRLPGDPDLPDCVFVEDTAVVVDELAVITRPGAPSRRGETAAVEAALAGYRPLARITAPATLDGGDVLRVGRRIFAGLTQRTSRDGIDQLGAALAPFGYSVTAVPVDRCLHLKSAVTQVAGGTVLVNPDWVETGAFAPLEVLAVDPTEPAAANTLLVNRVLVVASAYPRTAERLQRAGLDIVAIDMSELAKAEGALTCCSLLLGD